MTGSVNERKAVDAVHVGFVKVFDLPQHIHREIEDKFWIGRMQGG